MHASRGWKTCISIIKLQVRMVPRLLTLYSEPQSMSEGNGATPPRCLGDRHPLFTGWVNGDWIVITVAGCFARGETAGWQEAAITGRCHWHNQVPALLYSWSVSESLGDVRCRLPNAHLSAPPGVIIQPAGQECFFLCCPDAICFLSVLNKQASETS